MIPGVHNPSNNQMMIIRMLHRAHQPRYLKTKSGFEYYIFDVPTTPGEPAVQIPDLSLSRCERVTPDTEWLNNYMWKKEKSSEKGGLGEEVNLGEHDDL